MATLRIALTSRAQATQGVLHSSHKTARVTGPALSASSASRFLHQQTGKTASREVPTSPRSPILGRQQVAIANGRAPIARQRLNYAFQPQVSYSTVTSPSPSQSPSPTIHSEFEPATQTWQYIVADPSTNTAVIIDPVLDYDPTTQVITTKTADALLALISQHSYKISYILETHAHADHLTASSYLQKRLGEIQGEHPPIGIGKRVDKVQQLFGKRYGIAEKEYTGVFDKMFEDDEEFDIGGLKAKAMHLPGHTPDHLGYKIGENVFCGDSVFHADIGTARCDFPGGSANALFASGQRLLSLPPTTKIWTGHDYPPEGRAEPVPYMTVAEHKTQNKHLKEGVTEEDFVKMRMERDESLGAPRLLHQSLQLNIRGGKLPWPTEVGQRLLHLPLKMNGLEW